jgi:hypothetical protein
MNLDKINAMFAAPVATGAPSGSRKLAAAAGNC